MAYKPYIKNSDGTMTEIELVAKKVGTSSLGSATVPVYLSNGDPTVCSRTIPLITLNGATNTSPKFYAPTTVGTSGQILKSNGSGAPTWQDETSGSGGFKGCYDLVITTQAEFEAWYATLDDGTCTATSVLMVGDGGTLEYTRSDGGALKLPSTLKILDGINNVKIRITEGETAKGIYYTTLPTTDDYRITNIDCSYVDYDENGGFGFLRCRNLFGCTGYGKADDDSSGYGFSTCVNLYDCVGSGLRSGSDYDDGGFYDCMNLYNCSVTTAQSMPFKSCTNMHNCSFTLSYDCAGSSISLITTGRAGFYSCKYLYGCKATITLTNVSAGAIRALRGFYNCYHLSNCESSVSLSYSTGTKAIRSSAFTSCYYLTGCVGTAYINSALTSDSFAYSYLGCSYGSANASISATTGSSTECTKWDSNSCD